MHRILNELWEMDFENKVSIPFFACITPENCTNLGIPDYFSKVDNAMTLANVKVSNLYHPSNIFKYSILLFQSI